MPWPAYQYGGPCHSRKHYITLDFGRGNRFSNIPVASGCVAPMLRAAARIKAFSVLYPSLAYNIVDGGAQTYNCRMIAGSSSWSFHAWPVAIDINPGQNQRGTRGNIPRWFITAFTVEGFTWGGSWHFTDPMHFEHPGWAGSWSGAYPGWAQYQPWAVAVASHRWPGDSVLRRDKGGKYTLHRGMNHWMVKMWKQQLHRLGYRGFVTGSKYFGPGIVRATKKFQEKHGLKVSGVVGQTTWDKAW
jgi:D-alanyl-D-alanine carboxypeptidase-like protein/putative peptidoglycan binding protein